MQLKTHPDKHLGKESEFEPKFERLESLYKAYEENPAAEIIKEGVRIANNCSDVAASAGKSPHPPCSNNVNQGRPEEAYASEADHKSAPKPAAPLHKHIEFVEQIIRIKGQKVFRVASDEDAVWTEPLYVPNQRGYVAKLQGKPRTLSNNLVKVRCGSTRLTESPEQPCIALNPRNKRETVFDEAIRNHSVPSWGCYPPTIEDIKKLLKPRSSEITYDSRGHKVGMEYKAPSNVPNINQRFLILPERGAAHFSHGYDDLIFDGKTGKITKCPSLGESVSVICRCVGDITTIFSK